MRTFTYDSALALSSGEAALTASAAAQVAGSAKVFDTGFVTGGPNALFKGIAVIDITAIDTTSADELYTFIIQGSNSSTFASGVENLVELDLGATASRKGGATVVSGVGRYEVGFQSEQADVMYQYIRLYRLISGTTPSVTSTCFIGRDYLPT
jgi:hypothetical protein